MKSLNENQTGGLLLGLGAFIILVSIFFEYEVGWIGVEREASAIPDFYSSNWDSLKSIWGWQLFGYILWVVAYLQFIKRAQVFLRVIWSFLLVLGVMATAAYALTLGGYPPALEVREDYPELLATIRGGFGNLFKLGMSGVILFIIIFLKETFSASGKINKSLGIATLLIITVGILVGVFTSIDIKVSGASWFFLPLVLGFSYLRNGGLTTNQKQSNHEAS